MTIFLNVVWMLVSIFLIFIILLQRGKGGGLAGAFGGLGGSSAFGTRAGDMFTKITVVVFLCWLGLGLTLVPMMRIKNEFKGGAQAVAAPPADDVAAPAGPAAEDKAKTPDAAATPETATPQAEPGKSNAGPLEKEDGS